MERKCRTCIYYSEGVTKEQRAKWEGTNIGRWCDGLCNLYFPRGYLGRKPPHPAMASGRCFQYEGKDQDQMSLTGNTEA